MNRLFMLLFVVLLTLSCAAQHSPNISGEWEGKGSSHFPIGTRLWMTMSGDGGLRAVFHDSYGHTDPVLVTSAACVGLDLKLSIDPLHIQYKGKLSPDGNSIAGSWTKGKEWHLLDFHRTIDAQPVTVENLEQMLALAPGKPDTEVADQLYGIMLIERLDPIRLSRLELNLPGPNARRALIALSDRSAFLDPPAADILAIEKPDSASEEKMLGLMTKYVAETIHHLPNLFATRVTTTYQRDVRFNTNLQRVGLDSAVVLYRDGHETQRHDTFQVRQGLITRGEFGPILTAVTLDVAKDNLIWSHWERGAAGPEAVFRYAVDANHSHYEVENQVSGYLGEIAIDPSNGTILRVVLRADMEPTHPLLIADLMVEYGPEELGGKFYICPKKGVAFSQGLQLQWLNDVVFEKYHLFTATTRILPGTRPVE
jgi:hypothetical protein